MRLGHVHLDNFRGKQVARLVLGSRLTLLMGENGSGKTTILDAIAVALGAILSYLPDQAVKGISLKQDDIRQQDGRKHLCPYALVRAQCTNNGPAWDLLRKRDTTRPTAQQIPKSREGVRALREYLDQNIVKPWDEGISYDLPVIAYYGVNRALLDVPKRRRNFRKNYTRFTALADSLNAVSRFRSALIWFYNKEEEERRLQQQQRDFDVRLPELDSVRQCIGSLLPDVSNPRTATNPLRFLITHQGQDFKLEQLSDGYKTMLGLAMDLSTRMAVANPHRENPLTTEAVVLIDEVDLHLHPIWQRRVVSDLLRTFPNTQFVLTSHSPILVEGVNNLLKRHAIDHLLATAPAETLAAAIKDLYPLDPQHTKVYHMTKDSQEDLLDLDEGLTGDPLVEGFNEVSAIFEQMSDFEDERSTFSSPEEDTP